MFATYLPAPEQEVPAGANRAEANNVEITRIPANSSWPNRIEAQFTVLRYFALDGACTERPA